MRVLVVDDDVLVVSSVATMLAARGYQVWTANSAAAALELAPQIEPDVVITDLRMPEMDGLTMLRRLKGRQRLRCQIVYTASPRPGGSRGDADDVTWVSKTAGHQRLLSTLEQLRECGDVNERK